MFFIGLAVDYDGTLATDGRVPERVVEGLQAFRKTGRKLLLVTGRELDDLKSVFSHLELFERVITENGGVLYEPASQRVRPLAPPPPQAFVDALMERNVSPLSVGRVVVATWEPNQQIALDTIKALGLELQIVFNKGAVMVLPSGVNKASGLRAALEELNISAHNIAGIGDAENDHAFLQACGYSAAVANALAMVKESADTVTKSARGDGVLELASMVCKRDAGLLSADRDGIILGHASSGDAVNLLPATGSLLIAGHSGFGKSKLATALCEGMSEKDYQFCVVDPEGDFSELKPATVVGSADVPPLREEVLSLLKNPTTNVVVGALAIPLEDRPVFLADLLAEIAALRAATGHPHWVVVDEAHHVLPAESANIPERVPHDLSSVILITVYPDSLSSSVLKSVRQVIAGGEDASGTIASFCKAVGARLPQGMAGHTKGMVLVWDREGSGPPLRVKPVAPKQEHQRHTRKYAEGELPPERSFYFRGPRGQLNLRAQNLMMFVQIAEGVDDDTWNHHLRNHDYSRWFREFVKDDELASAAEQIETAGTDARDSRAKICEEIRARYTAPAKSAA
ncbi:MAG TPA: HAD-IIB family hydrolase [Rhizomicrobium sp.]|jgi:hypothetical protein|nr:HAD-IIB family hydrolase [Rhizomicrobium sp.]